MTGTDDPDTGAAVAVPQIAVDDLAVERNLDRIRDRVAALPDRIDVAVFPEYALTGFAAELGRGERDLTATLDRDVLEDQRDLVGSVTDLRK